MSAPHIILDCLPSLLCQKLSDLVEFDVVITKIILLVFLRHGSVVVKSEISPSPCEVRESCKYLAVGLIDAFLMLYWYKQTFAQGNQKKHKRITASRCKLLALYC